MYNIATIYRFNTPFLNLENEKKGLLLVIKKIEKSLEFDWLNFNKKSKLELNYHKVLLDFQGWRWKVVFHYISDVEKNIYHLPIFKLDIFLDDKFLLSNSLKEKSVKFLNNIFECFDWMNEKEFLIDLNNDFYYKKWLFWTKVYPYYDFSNIDKIKSDFESKNGMDLLENFILKFQGKSFILTKNNSDEYHKLHGILLYFIYLVFLMSETIERSKKTKKTLDSIEQDWTYGWNIDLINTRLQYVTDINKSSFDRYKNRLGLFFKMF